MSEETQSQSPEPKPGPSAKIKVHDKRMFTPDGRLREEYSFLEDASSEPAHPADTPEAPQRPPQESPEPEPQRPPDEPRPPEPQRPPDRPAEPERREPDRDPRDPESPQRPPVEIPPDAHPGGGPSFLDLVAVLAEPASIYLQRFQEGPADVPETGQYLELARLHIDLLDVLKTKTAGRLTVQESNVLEDALYQLRMAYVQLRG